MSTSVKTLIASNLPVGFTGSAGTNGYTGSAGTNGYTGSAGTNGYTGSWGGTAQANVNMNGYSITNNAILITGNTTINGFANVISGLSLSNGTSNFITWSTSGVEGPSINTRSPGTKLLLYPALSVSQTDYAMGISPATMWSTVPSNDPSFKFKWFGADIEVAFIDGTGNFKTAGYANVATTLAAGNTTITGFATVTSARGAVAVPTAGQNNSALYVTGSDTAYGVLFGTDPATGRGWIQAQRTDGTATTYALRLNPAGGITEFGAGYTETEVANTSTSGTWTMNCAAANFFELTLTGSITISPSNVPANGRVWSGTIVAKQDATGGRTITWPSGIKWPGGSAPPATTTANATDIWSLMTYDGGSTWVASLSVKNVA